MPAILAASTRPVPSGAVIWIPSIVSVTCLLIHAPIHAFPKLPFLHIKRKRFGAYSILKIIREAFDACDHSHGGKFAQSAQTLSLDLFCNVQQKVHITGCPLPMVDPLDDIGHPVCAFAAGGAFAA